MGGREPRAGRGEPDVASARLSDVAYVRIAASIASGLYPINSKLPTENDLADQLSVSRPIVREALARLRDDGFVVSRRGSGTYVRRLPQAADRRSASLSSITDMRRCLEFRIAFEGECAYAAAAADGLGERADMVAAIGRLEACAGEDQIPVEDDYALHLSVARATGNRFYEATMLAMREPITAGMSITRNFAFLLTRERSLAIHREHVAIYEAVMANDAASSRDAMRTHLQNAMTRVFEGLPS